MRARYLGIALVVGTALGAVPALGADQTVTATNFAFTDDSVTVTVGDTVTWTNPDNGFHNVHFEDGFAQPPSPTTSWPDDVSRTFNAPGTYKYQCDAHAFMSGTVVVQSASTGTPPPPPSGPDPTDGGAPGSAPGGPSPRTGVTPAIPPAGDARAPRIELGGRARQRLLAARAVLVVVEVDETARVSATGTVRVPAASALLRLRRVTKTVPAGSRETMRLRLSKRSVRAAGRALRARRALKARVTVTARDGGGNRRTARRTITLVR